MPINEKMIIIDGLEICCYSSGDSGEQILLLHGAGFDSALLSFREVIEILGQNYRVMAIDLPGYGKSASADNYSIPFYADIVAKLIPQISAEPLIVVGLSMGGGIALKTAIDHPQLVKAVIPIDAWGFSSRLPFHRVVYWYSRSAINRNMAKFIRKHPGLIGWSLGFHLFGDRTKVDDALIADITAATKERDSWQPFVSFQINEVNKKGLNTDIFAQMDQITQPTLIVQGSGDRAIRLKDALAAQARIANAQIHVMEGCRHWPQKERPQEFADAIEPFIKSLTPSDEQ